MSVYIFLKGIFAGEFSMVLPKEMIDSLASELKNLGALLDESGKVLEEGKDIGKKQLKPARTSQKALKGY